MLLKINIIPRCINSYNHGRVSLEQVEAAVWPNGNGTASVQEIGEGCLLVPEISEERNYFRKWSKISAASSAGSTTPSRVRSSLPLEKKWVVG